MAESAIQRLKRMAAEKRALEEKQNQPNHEEPQDASGQSNGGAAGTADNSGCDLRPGEISVQTEAGELQNSDADAGNGKEGTDHSVPDPSAGIQCSDSGGDSDSSGLVITKASPTHPIAMEMAELESALEQNVPGFATILRDIHIKLKNDPNVVTLLSDEEIAVIVKGLERHVNVTITAPKAAKGTRTKKEPISVADL